MPKKSKKVKKVKCGKEHKKKKEETVKQKKEEAVKKKDSSEEEETETTKNGRAPKLNKRGKQEERNKKKTKERKKNMELNDKDLPPPPAISKKFIFDQDNDLSVIKGLYNLGNTCFFNSGLHQFIQFLLSSAMHCVGFDV